eukprot:gene21864-27939_t
MEGFLNVDGSIDTIAKCLNFNYKFFALQILEILSACCYSEKSAELVIHGMRLLARNHQEQPFACLVSALATQDIEVKAAIMQFVNSMIMGADFDGFTLLRSDLTSQLFIEKYEDAVRLLDSELTLLEEAGYITLGPIVNSPNSPYRKSAPLLKSESFYTASGKATPEEEEEGSGKNSRPLSMGSALSGRSAGSRQSYTKQKSWAQQDMVPLMSLYGTKQKSVNVFKTGELTDVGIDLHAPKHFDVKTNGGSTSITVNPYEGTMAGVGITVSKIKNCIGKKYVLTPRWYELSNSNFKFSNSPEKQPLFDEQIPMSDVIDIRAYTTDSKTLKMCEKHSYHAFEIHTNSQRLVIVTETKQAKENWLLALNTSLNELVISKSSYKMQVHTLTPKDVLRYAVVFKKTGTDYHKFTIEQQKFSIQHCGIDVSNIKEVFTFLQKELFAAGFSSKLLAILQELLLVPSGSEATWDGILNGIQKLRRINIETSDTELTDAFDEASFTELLQWKSAEAGSTYKQISKLALQSMESEQQVIDLTARIEQLEAGKRDLTKQKVANAFKHMGGADAEVTRMTNRIRLLEETHSAEEQKGARLAADILSLEEKYRALTAENELLKSRSPTVVVQQVATSAAVAALVETGPVEDKFTKYDKMKKMLPEGAVRQKMMVDKISTEEIDQYFDGSLVRATAAPAPVVAVAPMADAPPAEDKYTKYDKMKKMLPEGAVRQKMMTDKCTPDEIDQYFAGTIVRVTGGAAPVASAAPVDAGPVEDKFTKYDKMKKMLPEGAVRQKMMVDKIPPEEIDQYFAGTVVRATSGAAPPVPAAGAPPAEDKFTKYDKMKKMLPEGAVRQKMMTDKCTAEEIDQYFAGTLNRTTAVSSAPSASAAPVVDEKYAKYDKMRKMLPDGAVRQKMAQDKLPQEEIDAYFGSAVAAGGGAPPLKAVGIAALAVKKPAVEAPPEDMTAKPVLKPAVKLKNLFWNKLPTSDIKGTIWHKMNEFTLPEDDCKRMEECFAAKSAAVPAADSSSSTPITKQGELDPKTPLPAAKLISALDSKRTQNVSIIIKKLRRTPVQIMEMIVDLDTAVLTLEMTSVIISILPTPEEVEVIRQYDSPDTLDDASKLYFHFNRVPRLNMRIDCHEIAFTWNTTALSTISQLHVVQRACVELTGSQTQIQALLSMVLAIGNYINGDTKFGQAYGVKLDTFLKLTALKAGTSKDGTLMNYLGLLAERHSPELMNMSEGWIGIWAAAELSLTQITNDIKQLDIQVNKMNAEFIRIKDTKENIGLDGVLEDARGHCTNPLYRRLDHFLHDAKARLNGIRVQHKEAESSVEALMLTYGENMRALSDEDASKKFFTTIATFAKSFRTAVDENIKKRLAIERAARIAVENNKRLEAKKSTLTNKDKLALETSTPRTPIVPSAASSTKHSESGKSHHKSNSSGIPAVHNLFDKYHSQQEDSSEEMVAKFRMKLHAKSHKFTLSETLDEESEEFKEE